MKRGHRLLHEKFHFNLKVCLDNSLHFFRKNYIKEFLSNPFWLSLCVGVLFKLELRIFFLSDKACYWMLSKGQNKILIYSAA